MNNVKKLNLLDLDDNENAMIWLVSHGSNLIYLERNKIMINISTKDNLLPSSDLKFPRF